MVFIRRGIIGAVLLAWAAAPAAAQPKVVDLATDLAHREAWRGETAGSEAALSLDRGDVGTGDNQRDLIVGAPSWSSNRGRVYVVFAGLVRRGEIGLSLADVILTGNAAGDRFGESTAAGYITAKEINGPTRDLVVGAPGANAGAGIAYVFRRDLIGGRNLTTAHALLTITGAPAGARLGGSTATGDLDGDGYREIILGAPGIGAVYVIYGGPTISGTLNLSAPSAAFFVIQGSAAAGVGQSLAAGDLTGDIFYDLAIGAFNAAPAGSVFVFKGRSTRNFPAVTSVGAADAVFNGVDAGDLAGKSLDISPLDTDVASELIIGAPGGDGPGNSRADAGEVYIVFGSAALPSKSLASADVTIYGSVVNGNAGHDVSAIGDIDRRPPNDLAILSPGANAGFGELHVVLGRSRATFATTDLATTFDRRLIGDPAAGRIQSTVLYDHTGEGFDDIVAGMPGAGEGLLYVSFSPLLEAIMTYPEPGQTNATVNHPFEWTPVEIAETYRLIIGTASGRNDLFESGEIATTSITVPPLPFDRTLYARIYTRVAGVWRSKDSTFRLTVPSALLFPTNGMGGVRPGYFTWSSVAGADAYRLWVGTAPGANDLADSGDVAGQTFRVFSLPPSTTVYARIMTKLAGVYAWSDISFSTAAPGSGGADSPGRGIGTNFGADQGGDAFLYKPGSGPWSMQFATAAGFSAVNAGLWAAGWTVKAGEFNADGLTDLFLYNPTSGYWFVATNVGDGGFSYTGSRWGAGWNVTLADFDGDGRSDVFLYNPNTGLWFRVMNLDGINFAYYSGTWARGWSLYPADFNADGRTDLFIYNKNSAADPNSGKWFRVLTQGDGTFSYDGGARWANDWEITAADFNGDGQTDLFLYRANGSWFRVLFIDGVPTFEGGAWATGWGLAKGDFNADGLGDLFLYNKSNGKWFVVLTERSGMMSFYGGTWAANWEVTVSDFDSDGRSDILLYNAASGTWFKAITVAPAVFSFQTGNWGAGWTVVAGRTIVP